MLHIRDVRNRESPWNISLEYLLSVFYMLPAAYSIVLHVHLLVLLPSCCLHVVPLLLIFTNVVPKRR